MSDVSLSTFERKNKLNRKQEIDRKNNRARARTEKLCFCRKYKRTESIGEVVINSCLGRYEFREKDLHRFVCISTSIEFLCVRLEKNSHPTGS
jgi:hypothetical protein